MKQILRAGLGAMLFACVASSSVRAQSPSSGHALYVEAGGAGLLYTINCDVRLAEFLSMRIGMSGLNQLVHVGTNDETTVGVLLMPMHGQLLLGRSSHKLEIGGGPVFGFSGSGTTEVVQGNARISFTGVSVAAVSTTIGYRHQPRNGGLLIRAALTPFYSASEVQMWGGISLGWAM